MCNWTGITCNAAGNLTRIDLSSDTWSLAEGERLRGPLEAFQDADFSSLQQLLLGGNRFTGTLPAAWRNLSALANVSLAGNNINGTLPAAWGASNMSAVDLSNNPITVGAWGCRAWEGSMSIALPALPAKAQQDTRHRPQAEATLSVCPHPHRRLPRHTQGAIPREWVEPAANATWPLRRLSCVLCDLSGALPANWSLPSLEIIELSHNPGIDGTLPPGALLAWTEQQRWLCLFAATCSCAALPGSALSGGNPATPNESGQWLGTSCGACVPPTGLLRNTSQLAMLSMGDTSITGPLPPANGTNTKLVTIDLNGTPSLANATLPSNWGAELTAMRCLRLQETAMCGPVPAGLPCFNTYGTTLGEWWHG